MVIILLITACLKTRCTIWT